MSFFETGKQQIAEVQSWFIYSEINTATVTHVCLKLPDILVKYQVFMVNTRQFSGLTYMQDMTKSHTFSAKNQESTYTPIWLIRREIRYTSMNHWDRISISVSHELL